MAEHPSFSRVLVPPGEPVSGKTFRRDGWQYLDTPVMLRTFWDELVRIIGDGEYVVLSGSALGYPNASYRRATMLVSPLGQRRIAAAAA